jgi:drug/metabolite transporter (DMT)-like permease
MSTLLETPSRNGNAAQASRATFALVAVCAVWGATFTLVKDALEDASSLVFLALRFGVASVALWMAFRWQGTLRFRKEQWRAGILLGAALFGGYLFQTVGLRFTTPARSAFLTGLFIIFVPAMLAAQRRRLPDWQETLGILAALVGLWFLASPLSLDGTSWGDGLTVVCAVSYAIHILLLGKFSASHDARALTLLQIGTAFVLAALSFWWAETPVLVASQRLWIAVGFTGILATALAFLVQTWAQRHVAPTRTAFVFSLEPVFAWITSFLITGERLSMTGTMGAVLILAGIVLVEAKPMRRRGNSPVAPTEAP